MALSTSSEAVTLVKVRLMSHLVKHFNDGANNESIVESLDLLEERWEEAKIGGIATNKIKTKHYFNCRVKPPSF